MTDTPNAALPQADATTHKFLVTFFRNEFASSLKTRKLTLFELRDLILKTEASTKSELPWLKLAKFGTVKTGKKSLRHDANVLTFTGIELDYDGEKMSFDEAVATLKDMNVRALIYPSPSHTNAAPRWRILMPVSCELALETRAKLCARINGRFGRIFAAESFTLSQSYYYGLALDNAAPDHRAEVIDGRFVDHCVNDLFRFEKDGWPQNGPRGTAVTTDVHLNYFEQFGAQHGDDGPRGFDEHIARIGDGEGLDGFNDPISRSAAAYVAEHGADFDHAALKQLLRKAVHAAPTKATRKTADITRYLGDKYLDDIIASAVRKFSGPSAGAVTSTQVSVDPIDLWGKFATPSLQRGLLPDLIERFAFNQGTDMGADISGVAISALTVCAAAIPDTVKLQVKRHHSAWLECARLWVAMIGSPSSKKTPIMNAAARPLRKIDAGQAREYADRRAAYDNASKEEKAALPQPKQIRSVLQDITIEAAQEVLKDNPDGVLCYQDELSGWFGAMDKYAPGRGSAKDRAFWLEAYNGGSYSVQRISRPSCFIENLSVSLIGGIQPEPIRQIANDSVDDGLLQRLLPIMLKPAVAGRDEAVSPVVAEYSELIGQLHLMDEVMLRFDEGAQRYRQELEERHLKLQLLEHVHRKLAAHIGKYDGIFARLCVIWHCIENVPPFGTMSAVTISEATARRVGTFLHSFLLRHAFAFYMGVLGFSSEHEAVTAVAGYILSRGLTKITNRDLKRGDRLMRSLDSDKALAVFEQLEAFGWLDRVPAPYRRAPPHWTVNPVVHQKFAERAKAETERRTEVRQIIAEENGSGVEP